MRLDGCAGTPVAKREKCSEGHTSNRYRTLFHKEMEYAVMKGKPFARRSGKRAFGRRRKTKGAGSGGRNAEGGRPKRGQGRQPERREGPRGGGGEARRASARNWPSARRKLRRRRGHNPIQCRRPDEVGTALNQEWKPALSLEAGRLERKNARTGHGRCGTIVFAYHTLLCAKILAYGVDTASVNGRRQWAHRFPAFRSASSREAYP